MSLGDHLEELRARIILALFGLVSMTIICLIPFFGKRIIGIIEKPYYDTIGKYSRIKFAEVPEDARATYFADAFLQNMIAALASDPNAPTIDPNVAKFVRDVYVETVTGAAKDPNYIELRQKEMAPHTRLVTLAPADSFVGYMKIQMIAGLILSSPWVFYQLWMFVAAGLYAHERKYVRTAIPFSVTLFVVGALFFLFVVAPLSLRFFLIFGDLIGVSASWTFQKYISFVTLLMLIFGIAFQTPIAIFILTRTGLVSIAALKRSRKYVFLGVFVVAAVATPPDVISQITLAIPLYGLFELGILLSYLSERKRAKKKDKGQTDTYGYDSNEDSTD
jgi:sec-independent protein translocase protein TatC